MKLWKAIKFINHHNVPVRNPNEQIKPIKKVPSTNDTDGIQPRDKVRKDFLPSEIYEISKYLNERESKQGERTDKKNFVRNQNEVKPIKKKMPY